MENSKKDLADCKEGAAENAVSTSLEENEKRICHRFSHCDDIKIRRISIGKEGIRKGMLCHIEVGVGNTMLVALGQVFSYLDHLAEAEITKAFEENVFGLSDAKALRTMEEVERGLLCGDAVLFLDGVGMALKIPDQGYPNMGVGESDTEKVIRGSNESFTESEKTNVALIRKRIRSSGFKVKESTVGVRSHTQVAVLYMEDIAAPELVAEVERRLLAYEIDGVMDSGILEQLMEKNWTSPFPQLQSTRRPDRAAMSVLDGKVVVLVDNSPLALTLPADVSSFLKTTDDYYNRFYLATFARWIRYAATFFSLTLPGLYLAVTNFHTQILPTPLLLSFWQARMGVPFPAALEVLLMELSFELLREAGVRLPGAMGNTIGIVGGLIIGQAAVDANLVSPIVVIVVAFTALCSFAIPNEEFAFSFRILKFFLLALCAWLGFFGFLVGIYVILTHLAGLKSFGRPYLSPFVGQTKAGGVKEGDALVRLPLRFLRQRPAYANPDERTRLKVRKEKENV